MVYIPTYNPGGHHPVDLANSLVEFNDFEETTFCSSIWQSPARIFRQMQCALLGSARVRRWEELWLNNIYPLVCSYMAMGNPYRMEVFMGMGTLSINGGLSLITGGELKPPCQGQRWFSRGAGNHCQHRQHVEQNKSQHCKPRKGRHMTNNTNNRIDTESKRAPTMEATTLPELTYRPCGLEDYVGFH